MRTRRSAAVDGFELEYDDHAGDGGGRAAGPAVVLLHGWPGDRHDYDLVVPLLRDRVRVVVPDLRGFGGSDAHGADDASYAAYSAAGQAAGVAGLVRELGLGPVVVGGYDVGSRVAQTLARQHPELVGALVLAPPMPGAGRRVLEPDAQREFWYQAFHQLALAEQLLDGSAPAVRHYLRHFWDHWSGPDFSLSEERLERLVGLYSRPGAFAASIGWYRAGAGTVAQSSREEVPARSERLSTPTTVLWPEHDPLFPREWSDRLDDYFSSAQLVPVDGVGHFAPLEYPDLMAHHLLAALVGDPPGSKPGA